MGVTPARLAEYYPRLYHMAHSESWGGLQRNGLLCTHALVGLFEVCAEEREAILCRQRLKSIPIQHRLHGKAVIRDQKPLIRSKLEPALDGCSFEQWLEMLNSRVFFWLTKERLRTLMCAGQYCAENHVVLTLDTFRVATDFLSKITLAPMNTGNTRPFAHRRGLHTFHRMAEYPFEARLGRGLYNAVVELAVEHGVPNIMEYVTEVAIMRCSDCTKGPNQAIRTIQKLFP